MWMIIFGIMKLNILKLNRIMDEKGIKQIELARLMGLHRQQINGWIQKPESIRLENIAKIATALDTDPKELIGY